MTAISSMILNDDQADPIFSPLPTSDTATQTSLINGEVAPISEDLLAEIQAIQEAMQNEEQFDFSSLESPAAGNAQNTTSDLNDDKSSLSPILLEDSGLLINYRSNNDSFSPSTGQAPLNTSSQDNTDTTDDSILTTINDTNIDQIQASVSEDFITQTQGRFELNQSLPAQTLATQFGSFSSDGLGNWQYNLNNQHPEIQSLSAGSVMNDIINLTTSSGQKIQIAIEINGSNDQAVITGLKQGDIQASPLENLDNNHPSINGKLNVSDIDAGEARFETNFNIKGSFGVAQINASGEWKYTLNNDAEAIQGLRSGEKLLDIFSVKTIDGSKQLIQVNIEGVDDKPLLSGNNVAVLDLDTDLVTNGSLLINDPDFGESSFQAHSGIRSSLGYGSAEIDSQGNWTFNLDIAFTKLNAINEGETRVDSFEVFTADGTTQMINIPIKGSNFPAYEQENSPSLTANFLPLNDLIKEDNQQDDISVALNEGLVSIHTQDKVESENLNTLESNETTLYLNSSQEFFQALSSNLNDINIS